MTDDDFLHSENPQPDDHLASDEPLFDPEDTPRTGMRPIIQPAAHPTPARGIHTPQYIAEFGAETAPIPPKTNPSLRIRKPESTPTRGPSWVGMLMLGLSLIITAVAALVFLSQNGPTGSNQNEPTQAAAQVTTAPTNTVAITPTTPPTATNPPTIPALQPTAAPPENLAPNAVPVDVLAELLAQPGDTAPPRDGIYRQQNAFTIAPARTRGSIITYTVRSGDTLEKIAGVFGLSQDTLIWSNDITYVNRLQPGDQINIMPENGVLHETKGSETIQSLADTYKVSPYVILNSEYNPLLHNARPETLLPAGLQIIVPGGTSTKTAVYWNPGITVSKDSSGGGGGGTISFGGGPGSCGARPNVGGTGHFVVPLPNVYTVTRGFTPYHTGIDLAASPTTTVFAADSGTVIFAGWSNWGYGNSIVIAHGWAVSLYGHLSRISVTCGQTVSQGQPIGVVGSTGTSTGNHLHFEVRMGETPVNPTGYLSF